MLIENHRTGTMERLGLGYDRLRESNPGLLYCEISGFGRTGPMAHLGGFDLISQGYSGIMSVTGEGEGRPPVKCAPPLTDITAGILAAMGILAAYIERLETGRGQRVDTSLFEAGVTQSFWQAAVTLATGVSPGPLGSAHPLTAPYQAFETSDGWITVGGSNQATWHRLVETVALPELAEDPRFLENADRMQHVDELASILGERFKMRPTAEWLELLEKGGRAGRSGREHRRDARVPPDPRARHGRRGGAFEARARPDGGLSGEVLRNTGLHRSRRPTSGRAHARRCWPSWVTRTTR